MFEECAWVGKYEGIVAEQCIDIYLSRRARVQADKTVVDRRTDDGDTRMHPYHFPPQSTAPYLGIDGELERLCVVCQVAQQLHCPAQPEHGQRCFFFFRLGMWVDQ